MELPRCSNKQLLNCYVLGTILGVGDKQVIIVTNDNSILCHVLRSLIKVYINAHTVSTCLV